MDDRLNLIRSLERKYGATITDVLAHQAKVDAELAEMGGGEQSAAELAEWVGGRWEQKSPHVSWRSYMSYDLRRLSNWRPRFMNN